MHRALSRDQKKQREKANKRLWFILPSNIGMMLGGGMNFIGNARTVVR